MLYEGASVIHGRPYPLQGQTYANLFVHFEPVGHGERHMHLRQDSKALFEQALKKRQAEAAAGAYGQLATDHNDGHSGMARAQRGLPYYVPPKHQDQWEQKFVYVKKPSTRKTKSSSSSDGVDGADEDNDGAGDDASEDDPDGRLFHNLAAKGMLYRMKDMVQKDPSILTQEDPNGWLALHEAARSGHTRGKLRLSKEMNFWPKGCTISRTLILAIYMDSLFSPLPPQWSNTSAP